jgi:5-formyltetrahydrofolate cyclo-ligase
MDKDQLRKIYEQKLADQPATARAMASRMVIDCLLATDEYTRAQTIFTYVATEREVETRQLIEQAWRDGKRVAVPRMTGEQIVAVELTALDELRPGSLGVLQPPAAAPAIEIADLDLIVVPGLAFTLGGGRLGRGRGHLDRWLAGVPAATPTIGLAFDFQIAEALPQEPHDIKVQKVLTSY